MKNIWQKFEQILGIYRWHPKIALRYLPIVDDIKKNLLENSSILEIGSGGLGIAPYLKKPITSIDINYQSPFYKDTIPVKGSILNLPFSNNSYSVVVCMDVLEHISPQDREKAINELLRICKKKLYLGIPCGNLSEIQDKQIVQIYKKNYQITDKFLSEHIQYGLPTKEWISDTINKQAAKLNKNIDILVLPNINLKIRNFLMKGWMSKNFIKNIFFRKILLLGVPVLRRLNKEPVYRQLFFIKIV